MDILNPWPVTLYILSVYILFVYMYEYGLGPADSSVDYFMAKRYYDLSLKYREVTDRNSNKIPINLALLRLRLKFLFNKKKFNVNNMQSVK